MGGGGEGGGGGAREKVAGGICKFPGSVGLHKSRVIVATLLPSRPFAPSPTRANARLTLSPGHGALL